MTEGEAEREGWHQCCCEIVYDDGRRDSCPRMAPADAPFCDDCERDEHRPGPVGSGVMVPRIKDPDEQPVVVDLSTLIQVPRGGITFTLYTDPD